jgi:hypothetical protein
MTVLRQHCPPRPDTVFFCSQEQNTSCDSKEGGPGFHPKSSSQQPFGPVWSGFPMVLVTAAAWVMDHLVPLAHHLHTQAEYWRLFFTETLLGTLVPTAPLTAWPQVGSPPPHEGIKSMLGYV